MTETKQTRPETYFSPVHYLWARLQKTLSIRNFAIFAFAFAFLINYSSAATVKNKPQHQEMVKQKTVTHTKTNQTWYLMGQEDVLSHNGKKLTVGEGINNNNPFLVLLRYTSATDTVLDKRPLPKKLLWYTLKNNVATEKNDTSTKTKYEIAYNCHSNDSQSVVALVGPESSHHKYCTHKSRNIATAWRVDFDKEMFAKIQTDNIECLFGESFQEACDVYELTH